METIISRVTQIAFEVYSIVNNYIYERTKFKTFPTIEQKFDSKFDVIRFEYYIRYRDIINVISKF